jgi:hypothetical protein
MTVSKKQLKANKKNACKGGVKTDEGKAIVKYNALKHGLLAQETVITAGEGAENPNEFSALLGDLKVQLQPEGTLEEMLVEKVAVAYWRLRRAYRYESGLIRRELDTASDDFHEGRNREFNGKHKTDEQIEVKIAENKGVLGAWKKDGRDLARMKKAGKPLEDIYDWEGNWEWLYDKVHYMLPDYPNGWDAKDLRESLNKNACFSDEEIWQAHIDLCNEKVKKHAETIADLEKEMARNRLKLQVVKKLGTIPSKYELDRLLRYEGSIERQFYKALNQLERLQRLRAGDNVPAPVNVDVDVNTGERT